MSSKKSLKQLIKEAQEAEAAVLSGGSAKDLGAYFKKVSTFLNDTTERVTALIEEGEAATGEPLFGGRGEVERKRMMLYTLEFLKKVRTFMAQSSSQIRKIV